MGIAGFFLWLIKKHPQALRHINGNVDEKGNAIGGATEDGEEGGELRENPRFDNLYLDMNGLIHPCCHDTAPLPEPQSEEEMFTRIFDEVDLMFRLARPRKCLFLAIDGVAPRSKLNQQRSRRFRAAEERKESDEIYAKCSDYIQEHYGLPRPEYREKWDHNVITPSTAFMERVGQAIEWFVMKKLNSDPLWRDVTVIFSDAHVPGEGEHKIMAFIRSLRAQPGYDPNTSHCIVGMDADLICLGLSTHEANFFVLRHRLDPETFQPLPDKWAVLSLVKERELLRADFHNLPWEDSKVDFERLIDDYIFLCFFVGNDFLPHVPLISIKTSGIEAMLDVYVYHWKDTGYLTKKGEVRFDRLAKFIDFFVAFAMKTLVSLKNRTIKGRVASAFRHLEAKQDDLRQTIRDAEVSLMPDRSNAQAVSNKLLGLYAAIQKEAIKVVAGKQPPSFHYGDEGYRFKYYKHCFGWEYEVSEEELRAAANGFSGNSINAEEKAKLNKVRLAEFEDKVRLLCLEYLRGMQWVMRYYTKGCGSWEWYFPFHYAPLLEDLAKITDGVDVEMRLSQPLHPVEQLLAVLPRESAKALPEEIRGVVMDKESALARFYPEDFEVDFTEAIYNYQGVIRLPFINCKKLCNVVRELFDVDPDVGNTLLFVRQSTPICRAIENMLQDKDPAVFVPLDASTIRLSPLAGTVALFAQEWPVRARLECPDVGLIHYKSRYAKPIAENKVRCFVYENLVHVEYNQKLLVNEASNRGLAVLRGIHAARDRDENKSDGASGESRRRQRENDAPTSRQERDTRPPRNGTGAAAAAGAGRGRAGGDGAGDRKRRRTEEDGATGEAKVWTAEPGATVVEVWRPSQGSNGNGGSTTSVPAEPRTSPKKRRSSVPSADVAASAADDEDSRPRKGPRHE